MSFVAAGPSPTPVQHESAGTGPRVEARELLDRWASSHLFDPYGPPRNTIESETGASPAHANPTPAHVPAPSTHQSPVEQSARFNQQPIAHSASLPMRAAPSAERQPVARPHLQLQPPPPSHVHNPAGAVTAGQQPTMTAAPSSYAIPNQEAANEQEVVHEPAPAQGGPYADAVTPSHESAVNTVSSVASDSVVASPQTDDVPRAPSLQSSADELDRLTNEILSRVSQISEDRRQRVEQAAAELPADLHFRNHEDTGHGIDLARRLDTAHELNLHPENAEPSLDDTLPINSESSSNAASSIHADHTVAQPERVESEPTPASLHSGMASATAEETHQPTTGRPAAKDSGLPGIGHILSYVGILGLTAGTSFVIVGYFGGPASYAPTGWLVSTIGQMLLFLGIVTLVSNGMEQTSDELQKTLNDRIDELSGRLESIGDKLIRVESAESGKPRRPHVLDRPDIERRHESATLDSHSGR